MFDKSNSILETTTVQLKIVKARWSAPSTSQVIFQRTIVTVLDTTKWLCYHLQHQAMKDSIVTLESRLEFG